MRGRVAVGVAAVVVIVVSFFAARYLGWIAPHPGPLHAPEGGVFGTNESGGSTVTAVFRLDESEVDGPVELLAAEAVGVDEGLDDAAPQVLVCRTESLCVMSYAASRWPPNRTDPEPVEGHVVDGDRGTRTIVGVPITLPEGPGRYRVRGLSLDYSQGSRRYRAEIGPNIVFVVRE